MRISRVLSVMVPAAIVLLGLSATDAVAQNRLGGHFGVVFPLVTHANGETTTISDDFAMGFPMGITVRKSDKFAFDLELVPAIQNDPLHVDLTVHPGFVVGLDRGWGAGVRMAFDVGAPSWGFTPILNHGLLAVGSDATLFAEFVLPIRFKSAGQNNTFTSVGVGAHIGVGF
jgi:hypothetical protein